MIKDVVGQKIYGVGRDMLKRLILIAQLTDSLLR